MKIWYTYYIAGQGRVNLTKLSRIKSNHNNKKEFENTFVVAMSNANKNEYKIPIYQTL